MTHADVLIVGGGQAGAQAAISLRQGGFQGSIAIVGEEPHLPYERPPLSKDYLAGEKPVERLLLRPATFWAERQVDFILGARVETVDATAHRVTTATGRDISYGKLIWAAGGSPRPLPVPGSDLAGVHPIRTIADSDAVSARLDKVERVAIVGGGYIGLEVAAVLAKAGKQVTVIEALDRVLARVTGETVSRFYERVHRAYGVTLVLGASVVRLDGENDIISSAYLDDNRKIDCELLIYGIGIVPAVAALAAAGARCGNGVEVDSYCRTSLPDVYAIGDCAAHENRFAGGARIRLESVQNAVDQAKTAASDILGQPAPYNATPWFWSNQYELRLQTVGLSGGHDATVLRGDPETRSFSLVYLKSGRVIALDCINAAKDFVQGRALVEKGISAAPALLADVNVPLKSLIA